MTPEIVNDYWLDNGVYELNDKWEIAKHWNSDIVKDEHCDECDLIDFLCYIDDQMPNKEKLGETYIRAKEIPTKDLKIGDKVYIQRHEGDNPEIRTVVGIAGDNEWHNGDVSNLPYIDLYDHDGDYSWNSNNYIKTETFRLAERQKGEM